MLGPRARAAKSIIHTMFMTCITRVLWYVLLMALLIFALSTRLALAGGP